MQKFNMEMDDRVVKVEEWPVNTPLPIIELKRVNTKYGECILATLRDTEGASIKSFLPARFANVLSNEDLEAINNDPDKPSLVCEGKSTSGKSFKIKLV